MLDALPAHDDHEYPVLREFAVLVGVLALLTLWLDAVSALSNALLPADGGVHRTLAAGTAVYLAAFVALAVAYALARDLPLALRPPSLADLPTVIAALVAPVALVAATELLAGLTGVAYADLLRTSYGPGTGLEGFVLTGVALPVVGGVALALLVQGVVQASFRRVLPARRAAAATVALAGVPLVDGVGFDPVPGPGDLAFLLAAFVALAVAAYGRDRVRDPRLSALPALPLLLLVGVTVGEWLLRAAPAEVGFTVVGLAVVALAAAVYDRAGSLWPPAAVYAAFSVTGQAVVFLETGPFG
ncbi:hypothetical protein [Halorarum salinum]|uniref:CPBP family intramembrane metalloprotease n=1 Tax=Halorarum salinum TaxID=2743089 RepID=A0A7D5QBB9_9EURY|nr:hypothetical protein [Halobaculum salinum]QLG62139.1 hypothetical protein HUG12_10510 [Halobaculum salinum]